MSSHCLLTDLLQPTSNVVQGEDDENEDDAPVKPSPTAATAAAAAATDSQKVDFEVSKISHFWNGDLTSRLLFLFFFFFFKGKGESDLQDFH